MKKKLNKKAEKEEIKFPKINWKKVITLDDIKEDIEINGWRFSPTCTLKNSGVGRAHKLYNKNKHIDLKKLL